MAAVSAALLCLSLTVFYEARGQSVEGQVAVAQVVLNRAREYGKTVCEVISQPGQFSWYKKGMKDFVRFIPRKKAAQVEWRESQMISLLVYVGVLQDPATSTALYFHAKHVPKFKRTFLATRGGQLFYR